MFVRFLSMAAMPALALCRQPAIISPTAANGRRTHRGTTLGARVSIPKAVEPHGRDVTPARTRSRLGPEASAGPHTIARRRSGLLRPTPIRKGFATPSSSAREGIRGSAKKSSLHRTAKRELLAVSKRTERF